MINKAIRLVCILGALLGIACAIMCAVRIGAGEYIEIWKGLEILAIAISIGNIYYALKTNRLIKRER